MSNAAVQWWVSCDVPGFRRVEISTDGIAWQACTIPSGWLPFGDYLQALSDRVNAYVSATWIFELVDGADGLSRVRIRRVSGTGNLTFRFESTSMAALLGFSATTLGAATTSWTGDLAPDGHLDCYGMSWQNPAPAEDSELVEMRHGRVFNGPWGSGTIYQVEIVLPWDRMVRLMRGPCRAGKVRITDLQYSAGPMDADDTSGYLDGYLLDVQPDPEDRQEADVRLRGSLLLPELADRDTSDEELGDAVLGSVKRGYGVGYWARLAGIPHILEELTTGLTLAGFTSSPTLVIDQSSSVGWQVDRRRGLVAARPLALGIHDPTNSLGYWRRVDADGAAIYTLAADLAADATEIEVAEDLTGVGPGAGWIGTEYLTWGGVDTGTSPHKLTSVTRGTWGPRYAYRADGLTPFREITTRPAFWAGRTVELWAALLDPYGRAVGSTYGDAYSLQLYLGEIERPPAFSKGTFVFTVIDLVRRLEKPVGLAYQAILDGRRDDSAAGMYVWRAPGEEFVVAWDCNGTSGSLAEEIPAQENSRVDLENLAGAVLVVLKNRTNDSVNCLLELYAHDFELLPGGAIRCQVACQTNSTGTVDLHLTRKVGSPKWLNDLHIHQGPSSGPTDYEWVLHPEAATYFFIREPMAQAWGVGGLPESGYAVVEGDDAKELLRYADKTEIPGQLGEVFKCRIVERAVGNSARADLTGKGTNVRGSILLDGPPGELMAQVLQSSGTGLRGAYDVFDTGAGYGIDAAYVDTASIVAYASPAGQLSIVPGEKYSLAELFGDLLAASWRALGPVRVGRALKLGLITTIPVEGLSDIAIGDSSLMLRNAAEGEETMAGPTSVLIEGARGALDQSKPNTFRVGERILEAVKGGEEWKLKLWGVSPNLFFAIAPAMGASLLSRTAQFQPVKLRLSPWKDVLPGQNAALDLSHPSLWDWDAGQLGFSGWGRLLGVERSLRTLIPQVLVLCSGQLRMSALCPGFRVTGVIGNEISVSGDPRPWFSVGQNARAFTPGVSAEIDLIVLAGVTSSALVASTTPPGWLAAGGVITYPPEADGDAAQNAFVHLGDGASWEF